jgi:hypothetical protein
MATSGGERGERRQVTHWWVNVACTYQSIVASLTNVGTSRGNAVVSLTDLINAWSPAESLL